MVKGEIFLARFPLGGTVGVKVRPVLLLTASVGPVPELLTAYISSSIPTALLSSDLVMDPKLPEFATTNLKVRSVARLHKLATLHQRDVIRRLGAISDAMLREVESRLRTLLSL